MPYAISLLCKLQKPFPGLAISWLLVAPGTWNRAFVWALTAACSLPAMLTAQFAAPEQPYEGRTVASVRYVPDAQPYSLQTMERLNPVRPGEPFQITTIGASIVKLFETGRFSDIRVEAALAGEEVVLTYFTKPSWFVGRVTVEGFADPPNESQLIAASRLELGQEFTEDHLLDSTENLLDLLRYNGFYRATIEPRFEYDSLNQQVNLHFDIDSGKRARFTRPVLTGNRVLSDSRILRATGWLRLWGLAGYNQVTESRIERGMEKIRYAFQKRDFLMAKVNRDRLEYLPDTNRVRPYLQIEAGPRTRITTEGARFSRGKLRQLVPVFQERAVDRDLLVEGARNISNYLQNQGYFDANVNFDASAAQPGQERTVKFLIDRGPRYKLVHLEIKGNEYFDTETVRERMIITPATRLRYRNGRFSDDLLRKDVEAIQYLYRSNGFREVRVENEVEKNYSGSQNDVGVVLRIFEGPQWFVGAVEMEGVNLKDFEYVKTLLRTIPGQPFSETSLGADRDAILNFYYDSGFPEANLEYKVTPGAEPNHLDVKFSVSEGRRNFVKRVLVSGFRTTQPRLIYDRISLQPGQPLSQSEIVEAQRRLYDLGIFAKVDIALQNPQGAERDKNVLYRLEEASRYSYTIGFGAQLARIGGGIGTFDAPAGAPGFSPRINFGVSRANFRGLGHTVGFRSQLSAFQKRVVVNYLAPQFTGNENLNLNFTTLYDDSRDVRTFAAQRIESSIQLGQRLSRANTIQYRFTYRRVDIDGSTLVIEPGLIPRLSQPVRLGISSMSFIQDKRDDPIESHKGYFNSVDYGFAGKMFGSQSNFMRLLARNSTYHPVGRDMVLARSLTLGGIYSLSGRALGNDVPLPERYFSGGGTTHRGFPDNQAGPRDLSTGFPIGGKALIMHSTELRFPLIGDSLGAVLFHDAGNVFKDLDTISFRLKQRTVTDFDYMVHSAGFGFRLRTPVGPVRFDLAYSPNSPRFFGFRGTRDELLLGQGVKVTQRLNVLQFHFSLGQTF